jgi:uncharacterized protein YqgC (DUF456 family)
LDINPGRRCICWIHLFIGLHTYNPWGKKKIGASRKGAIGALIGGFVGFIIPPFLIWLIIGPFVGALIGELLDGQTLQRASRVGWGSFLGTIAAYVSKLTICFLIIAAFMVDTVFSSFS